METAEQVLPERRVARALTRILQDGVEYLPTADRQSVPVTAETYAELLSVKAIAPEGWLTLEMEIKSGLPAVILPQA